MSVDTRHDVEGVGETVLAKIRSHAEGDPATISADTPLSELGIHSLELTEIIFDLEEEFGIDIDMNTAQAWENLETVQDIVDAVGGLVRKQI